MTELELIELCRRGESTSLQYKLEFTTQKANDGLNTTTQKKDSTTQKPLNTTQKRILDYLKNYPKATRQEVAIALGNITEDGVKFNIGLLQQYGVL